MRYLLDTHALFWAIVHPGRLSSSVMAALQQPDSTVHVNAISFWEIALKYSLGKLDLEGVRPEEFPALAQRSGFLLLPLDAEVAATFHQLPQISDHKDPFDRMLVWQAIRGGLTLISRDHIMAAYEPHGLSLLW